jgi:hypothetical protein
MTLTDFLLVLPEAGKGNPLYLIDGELNVDLKSKKPYAELYMEAFSTPLNEGFFSIGAILTIEELHTQNSPTVLQARYGLQTTDEDGELDVSIDINIDNTVSEAAVLTWYRANIPDWDIETTQSKVKVFITQSMPLVRMALSNTRHTFPSLE